MTVHAIECDHVGRVFGRGRSERQALADVSFQVEVATTLAVIGESGAGKSTLVRLLAGLDKPTTGSVRVQGEEPEVRRGSPSPVQVVFQHPAEALHPLHSVGWSICEPLRQLPRSDRARRLSELLTAVGLDASRGNERPRRFSGGQLQRISIARALASEPRVLLCDEPTSSLDVSVQAQILNLLIDLQASLGFSCVVVTHDLAVARVLSHQVLVLRHGRVEEFAPSEQFFRSPASTYAADLLQLSAQERRPDGGPPRRPGLLPIMGGSEREV